jgi:hypothetical protein
VALRRSDVAFLESAIWCGCYTWGDRRNYTAVDVTKLRVFRDAKFGFIIARVKGENINATNRRMKPTTLAMSCWTSLAAQNLPYAVCDLALMRRV